MKFLDLFWGSRRLVAAGFILALLLVGGVNLWIAVWLGPQLRVLNLLVVAACLAAVFRWARWLRS
jgi:hypothetical protein